MPRKRYKPEQIVMKLRQVDVLVSQGSSVADAIRQIGVSEVTYPSELRLLSQNRSFDRLLIRDVR